MTYPDAASRCDAVLDDWTQQEAVAAEYLADRLDALAEFRGDGRTEEAHKLEQYIQHCALRMGHGGHGKTLTVTIMQREDGTPYAIVGGRWGSD